MDPQRRPAWSPFFNAECAVAVHSRPTLELMKFIAVILALLCCLAHASPPVPMKLSELYEEARVVGVFEILEGKMVSPQGQWCGARYKARTIEGLKNISPGAVVDLGYLPYLEIGTSYLLVLGDIEAPPPTIRPEGDFLAQCTQLLPTNTIMGVWRGAMKVEGDTTNLAKRSTWTVRPVGSVNYPLGTRTTQVNGERHLWYSDLAKRLTQK